MILFLRRSSAVLLGCILILNFALFAVLGASAPAKTDKKPYTVIIDAGHGAPDGGCVGSDGTQEAPLNLAVSLKLKAELEARGVRVLMTRTDDNGIHDGGKTIAEQKRNDMHKRKEMRDTSNADLFVSIHMNMFSQTQYSGAQVIYDTVNPQAKQAASCIQTQIKRTADEKNSRVPMAAPATLYLLKSPKVPSVIVECGFLSNPVEREKLKTEEYQALLAKAVADGIAEQRKTKNK